MASRPPIDPDQAKVRLGEVMKDADDRRSSGLGRMLDVRKARGKALERGVARRLARRGENDSGAKLLAERLERNKATRTELNLVSVLSQQKPPEPDENRTLVRGVVLSAKNKGVAGAEVVLVDKNGIKLRNVEPAITEEDGTYQIWAPLKDERSAFVELREGRKKRRLTKTPLTLKPGGSVFVPGYAIGVERELREDRKEAVGQTLKTGLRKAAELKPGLGLSARRQTGQQGRGGILR